MPTGDDADACLVSATRVQLPFLGASPYLAIALWSSDAPGAALGDTKYVVVAVRPERAIRAMFPRLPPGPATMYVVVAGSVGENPKTCRQAVSSLRSHGTASLSMGCQPSFRFTEPWNV